MIAKIEAVCLACHLRGPWQQGKLISLALPALIRKSISKFYSRANELDQTAAHLSQDLEYMDKARLNAKERQGFLFNNRDRYLKEEDE